MTGLCHTSRRTLVLTALLSVWASAALSQGSVPPRWTNGPQQVDLGKDVAQLKLGDAYRFADAAESQRLLKAAGNTVDGSEVGIVVPAAADQDWMLVFEWKAEGYVKDDDKDKIDKDAILQSYKEGTEQANENRRKMGVPGLHVTGWFEEPHYDETTHNLVWALLAKDDGGEQTVNYNMRLLGREGYMSVTLIDTPASLPRSKPYVGQVLSDFSFKPGKTYAEFRSGDKVAKYGLAALVAGGAGLAAAKLGFFGILAKFLAKAGKFLILAAIAVLAFFKKVWNALLGRSKEE